MARSSATAKPSSATPISSPGAGKRSALPPLLEPTSENISAAANRIRGGQLVAFPTETVYGLGADATDDLAVAKIFQAKGRPSFNPLISHLPSLEVVRPLVQWSALAEDLANTFWPGPLTLVLMRSENCPISSLACAGLDTVAVRVPSNPIARSLLLAANRPVAAPSANVSSKLSPTEAQHVVHSLGGAVQTILDGGPCPVGLESTVLDLSLPEPVLLREGGVTEEALRAVLPTLKRTEPGIALKAPGMLDKHYSPDCPMRLETTDARDGEAYLAFGSAESSAGMMLNLSEKGDLLEAAANLFRHLHTLNAMGPSAIAVAPIPDTGIGKAINDRLRRAAAD